MDEILSGTVCSSAKVLADIECTHNLEKTVSIPAQPTFQLFSSDMDSKKGDEVLSITHFIVHLTTTTHARPMLIQPSNRISTISVQVSSYDVTIGSLLNQPQ